MSNEAVVSVEQLDSEIDAIYRQLERISDERSVLLNKLTKLSNKRWRLYPEVEPGYFVPLRY